MLRWSIDRVHSENSIRGNEMTSPHTLTAPVPITGQSPHTVPQTISPTPSPPLLGSPLLRADGFPPRSPRLRAGSNPQSKPTMPPVFENAPANFIASPQIIPSSQSPTALRTPSLIGSPGLQSMPRTTLGGVSIPGLVLPQSALPYCVAEV